MAQQVSFDEITAALAERGIPAYVEQTGGGCATIMVGKQAEREEPVYRWTVDGTREQIGTESVSRYPILVGPGLFQGPGWTDGVGDTADLYIGPDDDGEADAYRCSPSADVASIVAEIERQMAAG